MSRVKFKIAHYRSLSGSLTGEECADTGMLMRGACGMRNVK